MAIMFPDDRWTLDSVADARQLDTSDERFLLSAQSEADILRARQELAAALDDHGLNSNPTSLLALLQLVARNAQARGIPLGALRAALARFYCDAWREGLPSSFKH